MMRASFYPSLLPSGKAAYSGNGSAFLSSLPLPGLGQGIQQDEPRRHHVVRQRRLQPLAQGEAIEDHPLFAST